MQPQYVIRCTPAATEWPSYLVGDGAGEVFYFATAGQASGEACDMQERTLSDVTYSVEEVAA